MRVPDLQNYRHGKLTVIGRVLASKAPALWWYKCDCGNWGVTTARDVKRKNQKIEKSCGCARDKYAKTLAFNLRFKDLTGKKFGRLKVIKLQAKTSSSSSSSPHRRWLCLCDCGELKAVSSCSLLQNRTISCGCYHREIAPELGFRLCAFNRKDFVDLTNYSRVAITNTLRYYRLKDATPPWVSKAELRKIYKNCPAGYHVDHIHPLKHPRLCGLHVPWNLQYLPATDNLKKCNRLEV